ncbi:protein phosphatase 2C domain-containing protein [Halobacillus kuroshimensis]|uniref:protein phosphatase 2C domain-containing protein n=1 Tax=Halobacillus kuroshimensis TaxID=302481 RepID=UPI0003FEDA1A|nr:protein phosphatase 2C domain-containing protein [Halobacillus kuroshimensis]
MEMVEALTLSKTGREENNEDAYMVTDDFAAVIDGMTPKEKDLYGGVSPARIAVKQIVETIRHFQADVSMEEAAEQLEAALNAYYVEHQLVEEVTVHPHKRMGANLILYSKHHMEVWMIGDCQCMLDGRVETNEKLVDQLLADMRVQLLDRYLQSYSVEDLVERDLSARDLAPFQKQQYLYQNLPSESPLAYTVADGFPMNKSDIKIVPAEGVEELVLASDGYPSLLPTLEKTEQRLAETLEEDPLCHRVFQSTKGVQSPHISYDDRTYVRMKLS